MAFSKQHYIKVANILKKFNGKGIEELVNELVTMFREDNPRFDTDRFLEASGFAGNTRIKSNENISSTGGKTPFKKMVNEAFENFGMRLMPMLPVIIKMEPRTKLTEDLVSKIIAFEDGTLDDKGTLDLFSELIRTGKAWTLQGSYGRAAKSLIDGGYLDKHGKILKKVNESLESITEGSAPIATASHVGDYNTQTQVYSLWKFKVGNITVFVSTTPDGSVARSTENMPWFWTSEKEAAKQIAKWR